MSFASDRTRMPEENFAPGLLKLRTENLLKACAYMNAEDWRIERQVSMTKWFDYRFMTPLAATLEFVEDYKFVFHARWRSDFDASTADLKRGTALGGLFANSREFSTFWNARVCADRMGVRYRFFINTTMETALRRGKWKRLPRPGQLWNKPDCLDAVQMKWAEELAARQAVSELPHYRPENFLGLPHQLDHQQHVLAVANKRANLRHALGHYIDIDPLVSVEQAEAVYGPWLVERAREAVSGGAAPVPHEPLPAGDLLPSCFGLPVAVDPLQQPCADCPFIERCSNASCIAHAVVVKRYGAEDPAAAHARQLASDRSRRYRERKRSTREAPQMPSIPEPQMGSEVAV